MEYEYKLLRQLACIFVQKMPYTKVSSICMALLQRVVHEVTKYPFCEYPGTFQLAATALV